MDLSPEFFFLLRHAMKISICTRRQIVTLLAITTTPSVLPVGNSSFVSTAAIVLVGEPIRASSRAEANASLLGVEGAAPACMFSCVLMVGSIAMDGGIDVVELADVVKELLLLVLVVVLTI